MLKESPNATKERVERPHEIEHILTILSDIAASDDIHHRAFGAFCKTFLSTNEKASLEKLSTLLDYYQGIFSAPTSPEENIAKLKTIFECADYMGLSTQAHIEAKDLIGAFEDFCVLEKFLTLCNLSLTSSTEEISQRIPKTARDEVYANLPSSEKRALQRVVIHRHRLFHIFSNFFSAQKNLHYICKKINDLFLKEDRQSLLAEEFSCEEDDVVFSLADAEALANKGKLFSVLYLDYAHGNDLNLRRYPYLQKLIQHPQIKTNPVIIGDVSIFEEFHAEPLLSRAIFRGSVMLLNLEKNIHLNYGKLIYAKPALEMPLTEEAKKEPEPLLPMHIQGKGTVCMELPCNVNLDPGIYETTFKSTWYASTLPSSTHIIIDTDIADPETCTLPSDLRKLTLRSEGGLRYINKQLLSSLTDLTVETHMSESHRIREAQSLINLTLAYPLALKECYSSSLLCLEIKNLGHKSPTELPSIPHLILHVTPNTPSITIPQETRRLTLLFESTPAVEFNYRSTSVANPVSFNARSYQTFFSGLKLPQETRVVIPLREAREAYEKFLKNS